MPKLKATVELEFDTDGIEEPVPAPHEWEIEIKDDLAAFVSDMEPTVTSVTIKP